MDGNISKVLIATAADAGTALMAGMYVAHLSYRISGDLHLLRSRLAINVQGGYMALSDRSAGGVSGSVSEFCGELYSECMARGYEGVLTDFERMNDIRLTQIIREAGEMLKKRGVTLFVNEDYAAASHDANILIQTSLSGGSLTQRLREAVERYGAGRVSLDIERMLSDFNLSQQDNKSRHITREELEKLIEGSSPLVFFSQELCAHYFTYKDEAGESHFVLFDDAQSIRRKLEIGSKLGIKRAFLVFPEVSDILNDL